MGTAILVGFGLTVANFAYQGLGSQQWAVAFDRSFFQVTACLLTAAADHFLRRSVGAP